MRTSTCSHSISTCNCTYIRCLFSNNYGWTLHQTYLYTQQQFSPLSWNIHFPLSTGSFLSTYKQHTKYISNLKQNKILPILHFPFQLLPFLYSLWSKPPGESTLTVSSFSTSILFWIYSKPVFVKVINDFCCYNKWSILSPYLTWSVCNVQHSRSLSSLKKHNKLYSDIIQISYNSQI